VFIFGHLGFGRALVRKWHHHLPWLALAVGILLPDLIDKPLYYSGLSSYFSCTRMFGHTAILTIAVCGVAVLRNAPGMLALGVGMATHIVLDVAVEFLLDGGPGAAWIALTWPLHGLAFYRVTFTLPEHIQRLTTVPTAVFEVLGLLLLLLERRRRKVS